MSVQRHFCQDDDYLRLESRPLLTSQPWLPPPEEWPHSRDPPGRAELTLEWPPLPYSRCHLQVSRQAVLRDVVQVGHRQLLAEDVARNEAHHTIVHKGQPSAA